jgi:hypothetical protein
MVCKKESDTIPRSKSCPRRFVAVSLAHHLSHGSNPRNIIDSCTKVSTPTSSCTQPTNLQAKISPYGTQLSYPSHVNVKNKKDEKTMTRKSSRQRGNHALKRNQKKEETPRYAC